MDTILKKAAEYYRIHKYERPIMADVLSYLLSPTAILIKTKNVLCMAHPIKITDPSKPYEYWWDMRPVSHPNAWFVLFSIGPIKEAFEHMPFNLEWICFHRDKMKWRAYKTSKLKGLINNGKLR